MHLCAELGRGVVADLDSWLVLLQGEGGVSFRSVEERHDSLGGGTYALMSKGLCARLLDVELSLASERVDVWRRHGG